jgi:hypothetical protein
MNLQVRQQGELLAHLFGAVGALEDSFHFPNKTPQQLESTLNKQIRKTRGIIHPKYTWRAPALMHALCTWGR